MKALFNRAAKALRSLSLSFMVAVLALPSFAQDVQALEANNTRLAYGDHQYQQDLYEQGYDAWAQSRLPRLAISPTVRANNMIVIRYGYGGVKEEVLDRYENWIRQGYRIVIDGRVVSADAFGAFNERYQGQVCYTDRAVFSPHAARHRGGTQVLPDITDQLARTLVPALEREFRASRFYHTWRGSAYIDANRLRQIYPEGECSQDIQRIAREARPARLVVPA